MAEPRVLPDLRPCHHRCNLALGAEWKARAEREQFVQVRRTQFRHLEGVRLVRLVFDVRVRGTRRHQRVARHVVVFAVVCVLQRMLEILLLGVVGANDEVLHVVHAWPFEPT